jgi:chromosome segregation ATPase
MDNEKAALTSKNNALIGQIDMYQQKLIETNDKYVQAMQDFIDYRNNAVAVQAKLEQIEADNREYMVAIENLNAAVLRLYDTSRQQQSSLAEWQEYSDELQTMVTAQQNEIAEKNNAVDLILQELDLVENIRTQNQQTSAEEINDLKRQIRELQIQLEENNSTVQLENMRLQDLGRSRQLEAERNALRLEIEQLKKEMRDVSRESESVLAEQDATIRRLRQKLNRMGAN